MQDLCNIKILDMWQLWIFFRRVEVNMLCDFCFTFNSLSSSERILKIGRDLTKLLPKFGSTLFFETQCSSDSQAVYMAFYNLDQVNGVFSALV